MKRKNEWFEKHSVIQFEDAKQILEWEYTIQDEGVKLEKSDGYVPPDRPENIPYEPVTHLKDVWKKQQLTLRAPGLGQAKLLVSETRFLEGHFDALYPRDTGSVPGFDWQRQPKEVAPPKDDKGDQPREEDDPPKDDEGDWEVVTHKKSKAKRGGQPPNDKPRQRDPYFPPLKKYSSVVMYVGAADGHHIAQFTQTYKNTVFVLVDSRAPAFSLRKENTSFNNIYPIKQEWFGETEVNEFAEHDDLGKLIASSQVPVIFISDIRSENVAKMSKEKGDKVVEDDQKTQDDVLAALRKVFNVVSYMLKFRPPYLYDNKTRQDHQSLRKLRTAGDLWLQSFNRQSSSEMRIVGRCPPDREEAIPRVQYNVMRLDNIMGYINSRERVVGDYDAKQVQCIVALMRQNRRFMLQAWNNRKPHQWMEDHKDVFRFKHALINYNVSRRGKRLTIFCTRMTGDADSDAADFEDDESEMLDADF